MKHLVILLGFPTDVYCMGFFSLREADFKMKHTISVCSIIVFIFSLLKYGAQIFSAEPFD